MAAKSGLCAALGNNVFDYGHRAAADQMRTSWEKLVQFMGTNYGQDISNELQNKIPVILSEPVHTPEVLARHAIHEQMVQTREENLQWARLSKRVILETAAALGADPDSPMQLVILDNEIAEGNYKQNNEVPIKMLDSEKTQYSNDWRTYQERNALLTKHRGQAFSLILSQCTQLLQDRMKQDTDWNTASTSYYPLELYRLIETTTLAQREDQYPFATGYDLELGFYSFWQETMSNPQWYEKCNTKVDVGLAIGVNTMSRTTAMIKCLWCIVSWKESRTWNFGCARADYIILIQETAVSKNKAGFTKRQIKEAEVAWSLYSKLNYPSWKDFKLIIRSNQIKDCPVTVNHVDTALKIWGKNVMALKGKTTRTKPDPVARDFVKVPVELLKLHKEVYITDNLFFVNKVPFFLMSSCKICFMAINHLTDRTVPQIFMAFKEIYQYYLQRGFHITSVPADGEIAPLKVLIESLPGGPFINLASPNEHVTEIER
jgi:hypothetical protein